MAVPETQTIQLNADGPLDSEMPRLIQLALRRSREGGVTRFLDGEECVAELGPPRIPAIYKDVPRESVTERKHTKLPFDTAEVPFAVALERLINWYNLETGSNTPDNILAIFLVQCLKSFDHAVESRNAWYGVNLSTELVDPK